MCFSTVMRNIITILFRLKNARMRLLEQRFQWKVRNRVEIRNLAIRNYLREKVQTKES